MYTAHLVSNFFPGRVPGVRDVMNVNLKKL